MAKTKYPISNEFLPLNRFAPPMSQRFVQLAQKAMKTPKFLWKDPRLEVQSRIIPGYQGDEMEVFRLPQRICQNQRHALYISMAVASCLRVRPVISDWR